MALLLILQGASEPARAAEAASEAEVVAFAAGADRLEAVLVRPDGPGPFPAVVAMHGCSGLSDGDGRLSPRHADWAQHLRRLGFLVLLVDSFGSRGLGSQCRTQDRGARAWKERVGDALAARAYLRRRPDVRAAAVSLMGWSNGASTVLYVLKATAAEPDDERFASAVALYPGCRLPLERGDWHTATPLLLLIGEADDWTPAPPCQALADAAIAAGEPVTFHSYAGAYHDFDHPDLPLRRHKGLAYTGDGSGVAHSGTDPAARADAQRRVPEFFPR